MEPARGVVLDAEIDVQTMPFVLQARDEYHRGLSEDVFKYGLERELVSMLHRVTDRWFLRDVSEYHAARKKAIACHGGDPIMVGYDSPFDYKILNGISRKDPKFQFFMNLFLRQTVFESVDVLEETVRNVLGDLGEKIEKIELHKLDINKNPPKGDIYVIRRLGKSSIINVLFGRYVALDE